GASANYVLARQEILSQLGKVPFYPGLGNHEYFPTGFPTTIEGDWHTAAEYVTAWGRPLCYSWIVNDIVCIMLDHPPAQSEPDGTPQVILSPETLTFLETTLAENA